MCLKVNSFDVAGKCTIAAIQYLIGATSYHLKTKKGCQNEKDCAGVSCTTGNDPVCVCRVGLLLQVQGF